MAGYRACVLPALLAFGASQPAHAQCPDGTPPPCTAPARRAAPARVVPPAPAERSRRFLVLPFRNITRGGEQEWMVEGSTTMLNDALSRWEEIRVVSDDRLYPALRRAGVTPGSVAAPAAVRRLAEATGGWTAVSGEILATGGRVRVTARAVDVVTQRELVRATSSVSADGDVRAAYDTISAAMLRAAGLEAGAPDLGAATTRSLEAYRAYLRGLAHSIRSQPRSAQREFQEAVRLDSGFALAWARLAEATFEVSPENFFDASGPAAAHIARAQSLAARLPAKQRRLIGSLDAVVRGRIGESRRLLEAALAEDSSDIEALSQLAGLIAMDPILVPAPGGLRPRGSWNTALAMSKRVLELDPTRHNEYNTLVGIYASAAGAPPGIAVGRLRESGSFADMVRAQPDRIYVPLLRDTIVLVPLDSLGAVPRDSVTAARGRARAAARAWVQRWLAVAPGEAAAWQHAARVEELSGDDAAALAALARAESLGVEQGIEPAPVRRMVLLSRAGRLAEAFRLNDSLWAASYWDSTNVLLSNRTEGLQWAFALNLMGAQVDRNAGMLRRMTDQLASLLGPGALAEYRAFEVLAGNPYTWLDHPLRSADVRRLMDSVLAHPLRLARAAQLGRWMPLLLNRYAGLLEDSARPWVPRMVDAAFLLADSGLPELAWQLASNAIVLDTLASPRLYAAEWYRARAIELETGRLAIQRRFSAASATVTPDEVVFEWRVAGDSTFPFFRAVVPPGRGEYRWMVAMEHPGRNEAALVALPPPLPGNAPRSAPLAQLLNAAGARALLAGSDTAGMSPRPGVAVRTSIVPGGFRMIVRDSATVAWLRGARPAQARFRFFPCHHDPAPPHTETCVDERVPVTYP